MYEDHPELGQLSHSAIKSAVKSSKRMIEKTIRTNNIKLLDAQFVKQENAGFIYLVVAKDVQKIADGEVCANFVHSNYVQKESSIRTKLRVIRDPSSAFLFNAIQRFPGQDLEGICRQWLPTFITG